MPKKSLTDRTLQALRPAPIGKRLDIMDTVVPGLGVRVTDKADDKGKAAQRTFILVARFPGSKPNKSGKTNPTRRALGEYGKLSLEQARFKARTWHEIIGKGINPKQREDDQRAVEHERHGNTFAAVAEEFIKRHLQSQRRARVSEREIRSELIKRWGQRPVVDITRREVVELVNVILDRGARRQAHNILGHARVIFNWAINQEIYGLEQSPCDRVKPKALIGEKTTRQRVLDDTELRSVWRAAESLGYPYGPLVCLLMLTGQRKAEVAEARWKEFNLNTKLWTIPEERFKSGFTHLVPLSPNAIAMLNALPRFNTGDYLFSTTDGYKAVNGFSKAKERLDKLTAAGSALQIKPWVLHDLRRTVRTRLSALRVSEPVAEMVIGHGRKGLARVYDQHQYIDEMREALEFWADLLRDIIEPPPANVVKLAKA